MENSRQIIMMVDDNMSNLAMGKNILRDTYTVFPLPSVKKLFEVLEKVSPDLILMDVEMPEMNGYDAVKILKANPATSGIPVIFLTARNEARDQLEGLTLGAIDYITKPFTAPLLKKRLENHLLIITQNKILKGYNEQLETAMKEVEAANHSKSRFLASMSHEIRTPMNAIIGMSDLMRTDNLDPLQRQYFEDIKSMSKTLLHIINDILDFSKIEAEKMEVIPVHFNVAVLFDTLSSMHRFIATNKELEFHCSLDPNLPPVLYGDEIRIRQVITNLLSNAIKYTREGYVSFELNRVTRDGKDYLAAVVKDSGIGIKKEDFSKIFTSFQQLDAAKNRGIMGTGLGLSITKAMVDLMGGTVEFSSEYGAGSTFTAYIPLEPGDPALVEQKGDRRQVRVEDDTPVLVVDDNQVNLTVACGFLANHNINADMAASGFEALNMVKTKEYALIFMDHMMPEMDGLAATGHIRELGGWYKDVPIIALSANAVIGAREIFLAAGMNDFVSKPINGDELNQALIRWLPAKKVTFIDRHLAPLVPKQKADPLWNELSKIKGLDPAEGLSHIGGNAEGYQKALWQFCVGFENYAASIHSSCEKEAWGDYAMHLHAQKGVMAALGNKELSQWAARLEKAGKEGDGKTCAAETGAICEALGAFRTALMGTSLFTEHEKKAGKKPVSPVFLGKQLALLKEACVNCDSDTADIIADTLGRLSFSGDSRVEPELEAIEGLIESYDYEEVLTKIEALAGFCILEDN